MAFQEKQLFQSRPANTSLASVYSPPDGTTSIIKQIIVANTTAAAATLQICVDDDGTTYSEATALYWNVNVEGYTTLMLDIFLPMNNTNGNIAVQTSVANALTFTGFGAEIA